MVANLNESQGTVTGVTRGLQFSPRRLDKRLRIRGTAEAKVAKGARAHARGNRQ